MSYEVGRDDELDISRLTLSGHVNLEVFLEALLALRDSPRFNYRTLVEYETGAQLDMSEDDLRYLAGFSKSARPDDAPFGRTAIVAPRPLIFGLSRMYQIFAEDVPAASKVFTDMDEAVAWLCEVPPPGPSDGAS